MPFCWFCVSQFQSLALAGVRTISEKSLFSTFFDLFSTFFDVFEQNHQCKKTVGLLFRSFWVFFGKKRNWDCLKYGRAIGQHHCITFVVIIECK